MLNKTTTTHIHEVSHVYLNVKVEQQDVVSSIIR